MVGDILSFAATVALLGLVVVAMLWQDRRDRRLVREWAAGQGLAVTALRPKRLLEHPDLLSFRTGQRRCFRVSASDARGGVRNGLVILGRGFLLSRVEGTKARWDGGERVAGFPVILRAGGRVDESTGTGRGE